MSDDTRPRSSRWNNVWDKTSSVLIGGLIAGVFSIAGSYFAVNFQMSAQNKAQKVEEQRKVFARIIGRKLVTQQLAVSRLEARIFSDYHEEVWKRAGSPKDSLDLSEAQRWMHKS